MIVAIHQPNLFPWLGFFSKMYKSDIFIFLDHVTNRPNDAIYTKRVQILNNGEGAWITIPLKKIKGKEFQEISEMEIDQPELIAKKHLKTFEMCYKKAPYFKEIYPHILEFYESNNILISERNIQFITSIANKFNKKIKFKRSSEMDCKMSATELMIELVLKNNGNIYLSGDGAEGYQKIELYQQNGLKLSFMNLLTPYINNLIVKTL